MSTRTIARAFAAAMLAWLVPVTVSAQVFGTFPWQMQPYCNVVTLTLTNTAGGWTLDGFDNQCGATDKGSVVGVASINAGGNATLNFTIVTAPSGRAVSVSAVLSPATGSGTWTDSEGNTGTFALFGASPGLPVRPDGQVFFRATSLSNALSSGRIVWTNVANNTGGGTYAAATGVYTVPVTGLYSITYSVGWTTGAATSGRACAYVNATGATIDRASCIPVVGGSNFLSLSGATVIPLAAGNTVHVEANETSSDVLTLLSSGSGLTIVKLR